MDIMCPYRSYDQTSYEKMFTIHDSHSNRGLIPRATTKLSKIMKRDANKLSFSLQVT